MALKILFQEDFTIVDNLGDRRNDLPSFWIWNCCFIGFRL